MTKKKRIDWDHVGLGKKRDVDLASELEVSDSTVWRERKKRGIPKFTNDSPLKQMYSAESMVERFPGICKENVGKVLETFWDLRAIQHASSEELRHAEIQPNYWRCLKEFVREERKGPQDAGTCTKHHIDRDGNAPACSCFEPREPGTEPENRRKFFTRKHSFIVYLDGQLCPGVFYVSPVSYFREEMPGVDAIMVKAYVERKNDPISRVAHEKKNLWFFLKNLDTGFEFDKKVRVVKYIIGEHDAHATAPLEHTLILH